MTAQKAPETGTSAARRPVTKVLIANRGEIAVRVIRAAQDEGLTSVAVYADPDRDALHVRMADEAYGLGGTTAADSYLVIDKILDAAARSGADAVHPGYGVLSENADFAAAVINAGLTWIGPPPHAISSLGDKVAARRIAEAVDAPRVPGTTDPVDSAEEVVAFADEHGLPVAIKAAFGGGGRGIKVARTREEIPELYESAVREAVAAFGRGECFVERFLDAPRHVETQCLADAHGNVVVVSTRDCSLQRRNQKLVEEAPAPFLTEEQNERLYSSSKAILREAGYQGAGSEAEERQTVVVEVSGKRLEVVLPATVLGSGKPAAAPAAKNRRERGRGAAKASGDDLTSPMQGTVVKLAVKNGAKVSEGDTVVVIEAMKMEQPLKAHKDGTVSGLDVSPGDTVSAGTTLATIR